VCAAPSRAAMPERVRLVGINHVALAVGDVEAALAFYGSVFEIRLRGRGPGMAFVDMGDQFIALAEGRVQEPDDHRHFGLVVEDRDAARSALEAAGVPLSGGRGLEFRDPWGNHIQVVDYRDIQFTKAPQVLAGMELAGLAKREGAIEELRERGFAPA
jgi:lactoylglutathione lyase